MDRRLFVLLLGAVALAALTTTTSAWADDTQTHEGLIVSASADKLVMTDNAGKNEHTHMLTSAAKITLDGKAAKLSDLKKGQFVKVTTSKSPDGKQSVTAIDARTNK